MGTGGHYIIMLLLICQYPHHMTLRPPVAIVKRCYGINLYRPFSHDVITFDSTIYTQRETETNCHVGRQDGSFCNDLSEL